MAIEKKTIQWLEPQFDGEIRWLEDEEDSNFRESVAEKRTKLLQAAVMAGAIGVSIAMFCGFAFVVFSAQQTIKQEKKMLQRIDDGAHEMTDFANRNRAKHTY